jgi:hypothetical protein
VKPLLLQTLILASCVEPQCYPEANYPNWTRYPEPLDPPADVDMQTLIKVRDCLAPLQARGGLSPEESRAAECYGTPTYEIRSCIKVAVAPDWHKSACSGQEVFPCSVGDSPCKAKGQVPTAQCPCYCRAMIQNNTTIWVTPNRKLLPAYAVTMLTGCNNPWTPSLAPCSNLTPALP